MNRSDLPTDSAPEDLGRGTEVDGTMRGLSIHALTEEPHVLHLLLNEATGDANLLAPHNNDLLAIEKLLRHDRREATQHVVTGVHYNPLRAHT